MLLRQGFTILQAPSITSFNHLGRLSLVQLIWNTFSLRDIAPRYRTIYVCSRPLKARSYSMGRQFYKQQRYRSLAFKPSGGACTQIKLFQPGLFYAPSRLHANNRIANLQRPSRPTISPLEKILCIINAPEAQPARYDYNIQSVAAIIGDKSIKHARGRFAASR